MLASFGNLSKQYIKFVIKGPFISRSVTIYEQVQPCDLLRQMFQRKGEKSSDVSYLIRI